MESKERQKPGRRVRLLIVPPLAGLLLAGLLLAACGPELSFLEQYTVDQTNTPTPNPTLVAIERMLTATATAPTVTPTSTPTRTPIVTPSATVEVVLKGSRKLPASADEPFNLEGIVLAVLSSQRQDSVARLKAQEGRTYLDLEILLENTTGRAVSYTPFYLRLVDQQEHSYQPAVDSLSPGLLNGTLAKGEWVRGHVAFEIPEESTGFLLLFSPEKHELPAGAQLQEAWIDLSPLEPVVQAGTPPVPMTGASVPPDASGAAWLLEDLPGIGERIEASGMALTIIRVASRERIVTGKAAKGMRFVILEVEIANTAHDWMPYNTLYFRAKDEQGYEYRALSGSPDTSLQAGSLARGQKVRGPVIFEVPVTASRLRVSFQPSVLDETYAEIRVLVDVPTH